MTFELWGGIISGFATGLGVGLSNWLLIKRLERFEERLLKMRNGVKPTQTFEEVKE